MVTSFGHALGLLDPGVKCLLGRHKEDAVSSLASIHHIQLIHQEAGTTLHVLPPHLEPKQMGVCDHVERMGRWEPTAHNYLFSKKQAI